MIKTTISIPKTLLDQSETVARQFNIAQNQLFELAIEQFVKNFPAQTPVELSQHEPNEQMDRPVEAAPQLINQGDIFWVRSENPGETELGFYPHPYVVIQDNLFNYGRIHSTVVCALTSNLKQANAPGNVLLEPGEANLPKQSAVVVSKVSAINKSQLGDYIGSLNEQRIQQILAGIRFLQSSFFAR